MIKGAFFLNILVCEPLLKPQAKGTPLLKIKTFPLKLTPSHLCSFWNDKSQDRDDHDDEGSYMRPGHVIS